jgi:hypothetical protein
MSCVIESYKCYKIVFKIYINILIIKNRFKLNFHEQFIISIIIFKSDK